MDDFYIDLGPSSPLALYSVESETLWTGELRIDHVLCQRPLAPSAVLLRYALDHSIPEQGEPHPVPHPSTKENQAASSLRGFFFNLPCPNSPSV